MSAKERKEKADILMGYTESVGQFRRVLIY
jgi:hypothetical protein